MGMVFGRVTVEEPPHEVLLTRNSGVQCSYELRRYQERFAAEADYDTTAGDGENTNDNAPFGLLARYIGVFGTPENEGNQAISMTAPVVIQDDDNNKKSGTAISMTAPVVMTSGERKTKKKMQFMLPKEYDSLSKIPKPTNPAVHIVEVPPAVGAIHRFSGGYSMDRCKEMASLLGEQLQRDGVEGLSESQVMETFQFFGYNPPFTLPFLRRNEVWIPLTEKQVDRLVNEFDPAATN